LELETINLAARSGQFVYNLSIVDDEMVKKTRAMNAREREKLMGIIVEPHLGFKFMKMSSYMSNSMPFHYVARQKTFF
jgi:hypothetical protein